jgi:hypothetical protein
LNGTAGPADDGDLCDWRLEVRQNGTISCPPKKGRVEMSWEIFVPIEWMKTGFYRITADMRTANGIKMTAFEGTLWMEGKDRLHH